MFRDSNPMAQYGVLLGLCYGRFLHKWTDSPIQENCIDRGCAPTLFFSHLKTFSLGRYLRRKTPTKRRCNLSGVPLVEVAGWETQQLGKPHGLSMDLNRDFPRQTSIWGTTIQSKFWFHFWVLTPWVAARTVCWLRWEAGRPLSKTRRIRIHYDLWL